MRKGQRSTGFERVTIFWHRMFISGVAQASQTLRWVRDVLALIAKEVTRVSSVSAMGGAKHCIPAYHCCRLSSGLLIGFRKKRCTRVTRYERSALILVSAVLGD